MGWEIPKSGGAKEKPPAGNHLAVCVAVIDMGRQWQDPFDKTKPGYYQWRAFFVWELVDEKIAGADKNHVIGIDLTLSSHEKAKLREFVEARTGKPWQPPFDPTAELGQACMLNVVEKNGYPKVEGMAALSKRDATNPPKPTYPVTGISLDEFKAGATIPEWVPYLYGSPLADHVRACQEIGCPKPQPKKKDGPHSQPAQAAVPAGTPAAEDPVPF